MDARAAELIAGLELVPHPEGGYYREVHRSATRVVRHEGGERRSALTTIYFLLTAGAPSRWHRVASDEVWHFLEGAPLELFTLDPSIERPSRTLLGPVTDVGRPVFTVAASHWQAARSTGAYSLAGCSVGPGFDFADFSLLRDLPEEAARLRADHPSLSDLL